MKVCCSTLYYNLKEILKVPLYLLIGERRRTNLVCEFEKKFAEAEGAHFVTSTSMARIALLHTLKAHGFSQGDELLLTPVNIPEMLAVIESLGVKPVFVDFEKDSFHIDIDDLKSKVSTKSKGLFLTHFCGIVGNLEECSRVCEENQLLFIQDNTQASLAKYDERPISHFADVSIYSTCEFKYVSTLRGAIILCKGESTLKNIEVQVGLYGRPQAILSLLRKWLIDLSGTLITNRSLFRLIFFRLGNILLCQNPLDTKMEGAIRIGPIRFFGSDYQVMQNKIPQSMLFSVSNIEARLGLEALKRLSKNATKQRENSQRMTGISELLPVLDQRAENTFWRFPILLKSFEDSEKFMTEMRKRGIFVERSGLSLLTDEPLRAREIIGRTVLIPSHAFISSDEIDQIMGEIKKCI